MKVIGLVLESYGKYMKVRTRDGEIIVKSDKRPPKEGSKIELKDFGYGDLRATIVAKKDDTIDHLPSLKLMELSEKVAKSLSEDFRAWSKEIAVRIALVLEEVSKRVDIDTEFLKWMGGYFVSHDECFEHYLNMISGGYGLLSRDGIFVFINRRNGRFEVFTKDNKIKGIVTDEIVTLYFKKMPGGVEELENNLKKHFGLVNIKLESLDGGVYV